MSDLVKRLRDWTNPKNYDPISLLAEHSAERREAADRIEQLERENRELKMQAISDGCQLQTAAEELAAEKALAHQADAIILKIINGPQVECIPDNDIQADIAAYRKARGL